MDTLFNAILYDKYSEEGIKARNAIELEQSGEKLPDEIGAFLRVIGHRMYTYLVRFLQGTKQNFW